MVWFSSFRVLHSFVIFGNEKTNHSDDFAPIPARHACPSTFFAPVIFPASVTQDCGLAQFLGEKENNPRGKTNRQKRRQEAKMKLRVPFSPDVVRHDTVDLPAAR